MQCAVCNQAARSREPKSHFLFCENDSCYQQLGGRFDEVVEPQEMFNRLLQLDPHSLNSAMIEEKDDSIALEIWRSFKFRKAYLAKWPKAASIWVDTNGDFSLENWFDDLVSKFKWNPAERKNAAIIHAAEENNIELMTLLLSDERVNPATNEDEPLFICFRLYNLECARLLMKHPKVDGKQFLLWAAKEGSVPLLKFAIEEQQIPPQSKQQEAIKIAVEFGRMEAVSYMLSFPKVNPSTDKNYCIWMASGEGYEDIVRRLLDDVRVDPGAEKNRAIRIAAKHGYANIVDILLRDRHVDPTDEDNDAIRQANRKGHVRVVNLLLNDGRAERKDPNIVRELLSIHYDEDQELFGSVAMVRVLRDHLRMHKKREEEGTRKHAKLEKKLQ